MNTLSPEERFERALKTFERQVGEATRIWFAAAAINEISRRKDTNAAINRTPLFWITVRGALEQYALIAIGRIFDQSRGQPQNIDTILRLAYEGKDTLFSRAALRRLTDSDLKRVARLVRKYRKIYITQYDDIRNKDLAHTAPLDDVARAAMYAKTNLRDLERLICFLNQLEKAFWNLYFNGWLPRMRPMRYSVRNMVRIPLKELRRRNVQDDIVRQTRICLDLLTAGAIRPSVARFRRR